MYARVGMWISECMSVLACGEVGVCTCGHVEKWMCERVGMWRSGCMHVLACGEVGVCACWHVEKWV